MKKLFAFATASILCSCQPQTENKSKESELKIVVDTTPRVTGIGGIFFGSSNPKESREWYGNNLGLAIDEYGSPFEFRNTNNPNEKNYLRWAPFKKTAIIYRHQKEFMINYRVYNLEALLKKLRNNGVIILDSIAQYDYGKFAHILDLDSNKIELWEPIDSVLTNFSSKTTK